MQSSEENEEKGKSSIKPKQIFIHSMGDCRL